MVYRLKLASVIVGGDIGGNIAISTRTLRGVAITKAGNAAITILLTQTKVAWLASTNRKGVI